MIAEHISSVSHWLGFCTHMLPTPLPSTPLPSTPPLRHTQVYTHMVVTKYETNYLMLCDCHH